MINGDVSSARPMLGVKLLRAFPPNYQYLVLHFDVNNACYEIA